MLLAIYAAPTQLFAHDGAIGIVEERMEVMKSIGKAMKSISKMATMTINFLGDMNPSLGLCATRDSEPAFPRYRPSRGIGSQPADIHKH